MNIIKNNPLVSVVIPCYNQAKYLPDAIKSLAQQSYENWEAIIVNDGSTDDTAIVAETLAHKDSRIKIINQENKGLSGARNSGIKSAQGEVLQFLDADDILEHDKLSTQVALLQADSTIDIVFGDARYFTTENPELRDCSHGLSVRDKTLPWIPMLWNANGTLLAKVLSQNLFPVNCPLVKIAVFTKIGYWNENLHAFEDWEFWIRCAIAGIKMEFIDAPNSLALIRMHPSSMTYDKTRMHQSLLKMCISLGPLLTDSTSKMANFINGLGALEKLKPAALFRLLKGLVNANRTPQVYVLALLFYMTRLPLLNCIPKLYRQSTPWPIQKFFLKLFQITV